MKILVINCGSSSLKYQMFDMENEEVMAKGLVERIGISGSRIEQEAGEKEFELETDIPNHEKAISLVFDALTDGDHGVLDSVEEISAVGHRVVHGGEKFTSSTLINDDVIEAVRANIPLAPLHNPANIQGIESCQKLLGDDVPQVAVFDTAFHQTMPAHNYIYALPYELYTEDGVRRYGMHGTSHDFITRRTAELLGKPVEEVNLITCHLGNGSSLTAVVNGKSQNTSMGLTPVDGVPMGTRTGIIDPGIIPFLERQKGMDTDAIDHLINKESGVLGISGKSSDFRDLEAGAEEGDERCQLALDIFHARVRGMIGSYAVEMGGRIDAIVFTGGIGENGALNRESICDGLEIIGAVIDKEKNSVRKPKEKVISTDDSKVKIMVVPTDEELMIARDTQELAK